MNHISLIKCPKPQIWLLCLLTRAFYSGWVENPVYNRTKDVFGMITLFLTEEIGAEKCSWHVLFTNASSWFNKYFYTNFSFV